MSANLKRQAKLLDNYKMFRINTLVFWILCNIIYVIAIQELKITLQPDNVANDGVWYFMDILGSAFAGMVLFRVIFGSLFLCRFKCKVNCGDKYRVEEVDLLREVKKMRKNLEDSEMLTESLMQNEHDDAEDDDLVATISPLDMKMKKLLMLKKDKEN